MAKPPKPFFFHLRGLAVCVLLFSLAYGWSWIFPLSTLHFVRLSPDRVDCHIKQYRLVVISFNAIDVAGVQSAAVGDVAKNETSELWDKSTNRMRKLILTDADGNYTAVSCGGGTRLSKSINEFVEDTSQHEMQTWSMSLFGYATFLIGLIGAFFTVAVTCDWIVNRIAWFTYVPEKAVEDEANNEISPANDDV